jgi:hypothetical protein
MELVRGVPITTYCDENASSTRERLALFVQVCRAVQHAHAKGIIHRDLKPNNVLVTVHDGVAVPKVIDFGVATASGQPPLTDKTLFTSFAQMVGTPLYMSPEQAELSGLDVDGRSDVYSLGVLLYELLTGTTPLDTERLKRAAFDEVRRIIREEEPPKPSTRLNTIAQSTPGTAPKPGLGPCRLSSLMKGDIDWIVMKCLEKDRRRRYETAGALAADVGRYLVNQPITARPPTLRYRLGKFARRQRTAVTLGLALVFLLVATGAAAGWRTRAARRDATARLDQRNRARVRLYEAARVLPGRASDQISQGRYEGARETYAQFLKLAGEVYAPGELEMVHYRLKYASAVGNARRFGEAERLIAEAVADSKAYGSFGPWIDADACERLVYLYSISGQSEKGAALAPRLAELQRQLLITPYVRPPLVDSAPPSTVPHWSPSES